MSEKLVKSLFRKQVLRGENRGNRSDFAELMGRRAKERTEGTFFEGLGGEIREGWDDAEGGRTLPYDTKMARKIWDDALTDVVPPGKTVEAADLRKAILRAEQKSASVKKSVRRGILREALSHPAAGSLHTDDVRGLAPRMYEDWDWGIRKNMETYVVGGMRPAGIKGDPGEAMTLSKQALANLGKGNIAAANAQSKAVFAAITGKSPEREKQIASLFLKTKGVPIERPSWNQLRSLDDEGSKGTARVPDEKDVPWRPARQAKPANTLAKRMAREKLEKEETRKFLSGYRNVGPGGGDMDPLLLPQTVPPGNVEDIVRKVKVSRGVKANPFFRDVPEVEWGRTPKPKEFKDPVAALKRAAREGAVTKTGGWEGVLKKGLKEGDKEAGILLDLARAGKKAEGSVGMFAKAAVGEKRLGELWKILKVLGRV